jgi:hypothetical protein
VREACGTENLKNFPLADAKTAFAERYFPEKSHATGFRQAMPMVIAGIR